MCVLGSLVNLVELWGRQRSPSPETAPPPANQLALRRHEPEPLPDIQGVIYCSNYDSEFILKSHC